MVLCCLNDAVRESIVPCLPFVMLTEELLEYELKIDCFDPNSLFDFKLFSCDVSCSFDKSSSVLSPDSSNPQSLNHRQKNQYETIFSISIQGEGLEKQNRYILRDEGKKNEVIGYNYHKSMAILIFKQLKISFQSRVMTEWCLRD